MKSSYYGKVLRLFLFSLIILSHPLFSQEHRCLTSEWHSHKLKSDASYKMRFESIESINIFQDKESALADTTLIIPVVFHILYNTSEQNISEEQIVSQIDVLNEDYAVNNASSMDVPAVWTGLKKDSKIRFVLAKRDPNGNFTKGITRTSTNITEYTIFDPALFSTALGGHDAWPRGSYLNVWVCKLGSNALGFAAYPGSSAPTDGIVISYKALGRNGSAASPYNAGRTCTHEIGHWFSLNHIWGDDNDNCLGKDFPVTQTALDDTPNQAAPTFRCKKFPELDECSTVDPGIMYMNYMDYTDDRCMMFFTPGQVAKMRIIVDGLRDSLKLSSGHLLPAYTGYDAAIDSVLNPVRLAGDRCLQPEIRIKNNGADTIKELQIAYGLYQGLQKSFHWTGNLASGDTTHFILPEIGTNMGNQVMEFRLMGTDSNSVNNYASAGFKVNSAVNENCSTCKISAYPNPVSGQRGICVKSCRNQSQLSLVRIINTIGQVLFEEKMNLNPGDAIPLDLTSFQSGVYLLNIEGDLFSESVRFIYLPGENGVNGPTNCN
ncbi:MAG: T9SS type A sorting domain-containing protein [Bacteroidetes bacterium]|nr:T9SS type A sorting domain-containing protein [Bacteroidota bacterium]